MIEALFVILGTVVALWVLAVMFVAVMHFRRVRDRWGLTMEQKAVAYPLLAIAYPLDLVMRQFPFTLFFLRPPAPETVSALLEREAIEGSGWRKAQARWWREDFLADFDSTGAHGKPGR